MMINMQILTHNFRICQQFRYYERFFIKEHKKNIQRGFVKFQKNFIISILIKVTVRIIWMDREMIVERIKRKGI